MVRPLAHLRVDLPSDTLTGGLDAPIERVHGAEASPSISKVLERAAIARTEEVVTALRTLVS